MFSGGNEFIKTIFSKWQLLENFHSFIFILIYIFLNLDFAEHLKILKLKCTGTIKENWAIEKNVIDKKSPRGTYAVKHEQNSGISYTRCNRFKISLDRIYSYRDNSSITVEGL